MFTIRDLSPRRLFVALALLIGTITPVASMAAPIVVSNAHISAIWKRYSYYSDSTKISQVGSAYQACSGRYFMEWGYETPYYSVEWESCQ